MPLRRNKKNNGNENTPEKRRLTHMLGLFRKGGRLSFKKGQKRNFDTIGRQIASQYHAYLRDHPRISKEAKKMLLSSLVANHVTKTSMIIKTLTNRKKYEKMVNDLALSMTTNSSYDKIKQAKERLVKELGNEKIVNELMGYTFTILDAALIHLEVKH